MRPKCGQRRGPAVCVLEQNYDATQRIPAYRSEQAVLSTYGQLEDRMALLADWLCARGWRARQETIERASSSSPTRWPQLWGTGSQWSAADAAWRFTWASQRADDERTVGA
jgi:hypothetical protein